MKVIREIDIKYIIDNYLWVSTFLVSGEIRDPMILGISWNDIQDVIYNYPLRCIYAAKNKRVSIYLIDQAPTSLTVDFDVRTATPGKTPHASTFWLDVENTGRVEAPHPASREFSAPT